ncbi:nitroreductase/quinone reductase family protein [Rathayibacter toxicus]|uniref:nitroreductase/quinone reductase family protein n=1 Tax=Rathayibacter toxicus TaxID=145458 RepID=UPI001C046732|nr:nitroreductase/quinone reductase family protein [Rathayibacter toxicus]QWL31418.1 nitroreductase family deazaflavin-dependent oxidoreductase [Rathayibacter toxicus]QWL33509.1 nitroreductase family deazaflavin-dependent oxidoreductase [Rathayibacter toxicus]QWL35644.1 nitroreductase family deazaflavin-dependent oxidoreductase [Rathayibacter toxicus]QWL37733.1 nitroreductase family deazaflavin-dependent oxidoreductase [Rathayibacter toxicus]QWL39823.1 nitroreductase family deazaflavin-depende
MADWNEHIIDEFRANGGTVTTAGFGRSLVLLHHRGARSGDKRVTPLVALRPSDDIWLIAASKAGAPNNPAWFHNLVAHPDVTIETPDDGTIEVRAEVLEGEERDAAWARFTSASEGFREYQKKTSRVIPVVALHRQR